MAESDEETLLDLLRNTPEVPPTQSDLLFKALAELGNQLSDIKLKLDVSNEIAIERLELQREEARSEFGAQARPSRNMPPSSFRRWT